MTRKELNTEELAELRASPYVASIISGRINFTPEFKREAYRQLMDGKSMRTIFEEHGIAPEILGDKRIWGFAHKLRTNADRDEGFADLRKNNSRKPAKETREQTLAARVEQLEHELAYTRQEVEFLKKIHTADLEARKSWESRLRQKCNLPSSAKPPFGMTTSSRSASCVRSPVFPDRVITTGALPWKFAVPVKTRTARTLT